MEQHEKAVQAISARLREFFVSKTAYRIYHGSTNSTRNYKVDRERMIDTSALNHVLEVDKSRRTATVEPNVPMDQLVDETLKHGLLPPVVMEFPGITVGGGYSGTSGESSSFRHGFFDNTIEWVEFILPDGKVLRTSKADHQDLFHGAAGALGTLGVATLFGIRLIDACPYVELSYQPFESGALTLAAVKEEAATASKAQPNDGKLPDYIDGVIFSGKLGACITGRLIASLPSSINVQRFTRATDPWFYIHAEKVSNKALAAGSHHVEAVPIRDYLFRYDRGAFWTGRLAFSYFSTPFNRATRAALDSLMHTRRMYHALHASGISRRFVIQDVALPVSQAQHFLEWLDENLPIYPLWLCPLRPPPPETMHPHSSLSSNIRKADTSGANGNTSGEPALQDTAIGANDNTSTPQPQDEDEKEDEPLMNVGVWGFGPATKHESTRVNRELERRVHDLGGMKWLYAQTFYTEAEFWRNFDRSRYDALREKYGSAHLPNVYDKVKRSEAAIAEDGGDGDNGGDDDGGSVAPGRLAGLYGVLHSVIARDYLLAKKTGKKEKEK